MRQRHQELATKIAELDGEVAEHRLVIKTLEKTSSDRKCFRMIGGVLVERTVGEVLPAVKQNESGVSKIINKTSKSKSIHFMYVCMHVCMYVCVYIVG